MQGLESRLQDLIIHYLASCVQVCNGKRKMSITITELVFVLCLCANNKKCWNVKIKDFPIVCLILLQILMSCILLFVSWTIWPHRRSFCIGIYYDVISVFRLYTNSTHYVLATFQCTLFSLKTKFWTRMKFCYITKSTLIILYDTRTYWGTHLKYCSLEK